MPRTFRPLLLALFCALVALPAVLLPASASAKSPAKLTLVLPLTAHSAGLAKYATDVSTPGNSLYHHYRSITWLAAHFGASAANEQKVVAYLRAAGATGVKVDRTGLFVDATLAATRAESLFGNATERRAARDGEVRSATPASTRIPSALRGAITGVVGLDTDARVSAAALTRGSAASATPTAWPAATAGSAFSSVAAPIVRQDAASPRNTINGVDSGSGYLGPEPNGSAPSATAPNGVPPTTDIDGGTPTGCAAGEDVDGFTPNEYLTAYNYGALQSTGTLGQGERVALIEIDGFRQSDVSTFASCFGLSQPKIVAFRTDKAVSAAGLPPGGESTLDLEVLDAAAPDLSQIDVYESSGAIGDTLESLTAPLQNSRYKPEVISASLGLCEAQTEEGIGAAGLRDVEAALEEAAASGISVLAAAGDDGSATCTGSTATDSAPIPELAVSFPASSPYVTAVGGTNLTLNSANAIVTQPVWNDDAAAPGSAGGGGLSKLFKRPSYQTGVVAGATRAVPDVAMLADIAPGYDIYCTADPECISTKFPNPWAPVGGTSAATPLLAGGLALIDQQLREHKQQSLGLINPLLYSLGKNPATAPLVFSDVSTGSDDVGPFIGSDAPLGCCTAIPGFDDASGWGSVNLGNLEGEAIAATPALVKITEKLPGNQRPAVHKRIYDRVSCSGACLTGALARIKIGKLRVVTEYSGLAHLTKAGSRLISIVIPKAEVTRLRAGIAHHLKITATVIGAIVDPAGNIERSTPGKTITISK
jgi:subtilase family serine protease